MSRKIFFHIGCPKTGSSSIQASLRHLSNEDWAFLSLTKTGNDSGPLITAFREKPWNSRFHRLNAHTPHDLKSLSAQTQDRYAHLITSSAAAHLILSGESMTEFSIADFQSVRDFTESLGCTPVIVAYFRPLQSWLESALQQRLKGNTLRCLEATSLADAISSRLPPYPALINNLYSVFGSLQVRLFAFEPYQFPANDIVVDFCLRLGVRSNSNSFIRVNERVSLLSIKVLCLAASLPLNQHGLPDVYRDGPLASHRDSFVRLIISEFADQPKFSICPSLLNDISSTYRSNYMELDPFIESHSDFSLFSPLSEDLDSGDSISSFEELLLLTPSERMTVLSCLEKRGYNREKLSKRSDSSLASFYCR